MIPALRHIQNTVNDEERIFAFISNHFRDMQHVVTVLQPFSSKALDIKIKSPNWLSSTNGTISLETTDTARDFNVTIEPIYKAGFVQVLGILIILGALSIGVQVGRAVTKKSHDNS
jgi:hypothetical protein